MLKGKKILIAVTGSIAAYKIPSLVRLLIKAGAEVKIVMTDAAKGFVSPLTLATLSKNPVLSDLFKNDSWSNHVMLGRWADIMLIAPLSCNTLAKLAVGGCDNLLLAVYLSATCKVAVAPAMDEDMLLHPSTKANLATITSFGNIVLPVNKGELASGLIGEGRMAEPEEITEWLKQYFSNDLALTGKQALVTAGPTYEQIDPVRFIGNNSSGRMGIAIAEALQQAGATVTLVLGPTHLVPSPLLNTVHVKSARQMFEACETRFKQMDIAVMNAAVADYTPVNVAVQKIKKADAALSVELTKTTDILKHLGEIKSGHQYLVGFALETNNEEANAQTKLVQKHADMIVLNSLNDEGAGFAGNTNKVTIFEKSGQTLRFETKSKTAVAKDIVNAIINFTK
ncbi:MAG: bifunctional phosphopantothenoylcysteine decarboxylase/phosphopantothenate--cysteine ligase CoaBC [Ferruginibacter sp.]|nr:bifunctional phosphopantothenoylcysteine decarboxylase/phosphopantothenate--cysteine ligase CoaBC [Ferruginibacter sp.]